MRSIVGNAPPLDSGEPVGLRDVTASDARGAAVLANGVRYEEPAPDGETAFVRGDANQSGIIDLSDAVYVLGYLFLGSPRTIACLDAADLWKALGAIQVGRETSADTLYMDVRQDVLPSGLTRIAVPMKIYRGRTRGSNEPLRPVHSYPGDLRDTDALAGWIAALPESR